MRPHKMKRHKAGCFCATFYFSGMNLTILIVAVTCITSLLAFNNPVMNYNLLFYPYRVFRFKEWHRIISGCFIHLNYTHLILNMIALYSFGVFVENSFDYVFHEKGRLLYVLLYFGGVIFADIPSLIKDRNNQQSTGLGASGGVSAVVFAAILLNPFSKIYLMFIPIGIPSFVFGPLYVAYCIYMDNYGHQHKTGITLIDNASHSAHLWGSVFGFIFPIIFAPWLFMRFIGLLTNGAIS